MLIGDSNTQGVPSKEFGWAYLLKCDLEQSGYNVKFYNYGIGLATTTQCERILEIALENHYPHIVIYTAGIVDVLFNHPLDKMQQHIENSIQQCAKYNATVLFGVIDVTCWEYKYNFNLIYLLQSNSVFLNIAYKCPVIAFEYLNNQVLAQLEYNVGDWIHPNLQGNILIYLRVKEKLLDIFSKLPNSLY